MLFQSSPGFYVYQKQEGTGNIKLVKSFDTMDELLSSLGHWRNATSLVHPFFSIHFDDRYTGSLVYYDSVIVPAPVRFWDEFNGQLLNRRTFYCYVVYDHNGNIVTPNQLIEFHHHWYRRKKKWRWRYTPGSKRRWHFGCYYRRMRTFQERKWSFDVQDGVKCRAARNFHNLSSSWDDIPRSLQKSWKKQGKRRHQWKPKTR